MEISEFNQRLYEECKKIRVDLSDSQINSFYKYMELILEWNKNINLTNIIEPKEIITKHFVDSLTITKYIQPQETIIDVGTGAGFPGIPIKIAYPETKITLLDSLNKRINFLNEVIEKLALKNIQAIHDRAEDAGKNNIYREKYDIAVSRAVAPLNILLEYITPFIKIEGKCICMKGSKVKEEIEESKKALCKLNSEIVQKEQFFLPNTDITRSIVIVQKKEKTDKVYPRKSGIPSKQPL